MKFVTVMVVYMHTCEALQQLVKSVYSHCDVEFNPGPQVCAYGIVDVRPVQTQPAIDLP